ncbi:MAG: DNA recombination protein RmuC [Dehalococcoidia bacterium]
MEQIILGIVGFIIGVIACSIYWKLKIDIKNSEIQNLLDQKEQINSNTQDLKETFTNIASDALKNNNESFLTLANEKMDNYQNQAKSDLEKRQLEIQKLINPAIETIKAIDNRIENFDKDRIRSQTSTYEQMNVLIKETSDLSKALRAPNLRGAWGEMQLRRVVEIAGMIKFCDFVEQKVFTDEDTRIIPDLVVNMAGGKNIVVDAKTPMDAYIKAIESEDKKIRENYITQHVKNTREHVTSLSSKKYWEQFPDSPELVVMFIPIESVYMSILDSDSSLLEWASNRNVVIASPLSLLAILKAFAVGWREESMAENAKQISDLGRELYERLSVFTDHFGHVESALGRTVDAFNKAVSSFQSRVFVTAKKFKDINIIDENDTSLEMKQIDKVTKKIEKE